MKRILQMGIILLVIVIFSVSAFAAVKPTETAELNYICVKEYGTKFIIDSDGTATMRGILLPKTSTAVDEVKVTFTIDKSSGSNVYNKTWNASWDRSFEEYKAEKDYKLPSKGTYILSTKFKCYKNGKLIETVNGNDITKTYS